MTTYLVTGCAGFIGTIFVHYMLNRYTDIKIINLDALTYASNLENLKDLEDDPYTSLFTVISVIKSSSQSSSRTMIPTTSSISQPSLFMLYNSIIER